MTLRMHAALALLALSTLAGCASSIVGAECRTGFSECGGECVDLVNDFRNCGACGNDCGLFVCDLGMCSTTELRPPDDGGLLDGDVEGGAGSGADSGSGSDGGLGPDSGLSGCGLGEMTCPMGCFDLLTSHAACGDCDTECDPDQVCSAGMCADVCEPPLTFCGGECFDITSDEDHCGSCSNVCPSGICDDGECIGAIPGFVIVIGHDFVTSMPSKGMRRIAGNAALALPRGAPVRVLEFAGEASTSSVNGVRSAIALVEEESGRAWQRIDAIEAIVPVQLRDADVFVIHAQAVATKSTLKKLRDQWDKALVTFVAQGGVVVLFEAPSTKNDGTFRLLPTEIFEATARIMIPPQTLRMVAPGLALTARVPDRYVSSGQSVRFAGVEGAEAIVVDDADRPVVLQRIVLP